eukprot:CAMPEP_0170174408 /NCGR_PEP_ID=MMETSP0040_2-20121228/7626_1 /TAXON_ID=641309 /ORGANISM="Lotharella oceanica, Strain CCMP622" /LENGTH=363 /DNA_ID=CAMNT_0010416029 /DNA_START=257 /DNA_END=1345 /DNA_ORIENTATION=-
MSTYASPVKEMQLTVSSTCLAMSIIGTAKGGSSTLARILAQNFGFEAPRRAYNMETFHCLPLMDRVCSWPTTRLDPHEATSYLVRKCNTTACWKRNYARFDKMSVQLMEKNPDAIMWSHIATAYSKEVTRCGTRMVVTLRDPVRRLYSHYAWYLLNLQDLPFTRYVDALLDIHKDDLHELEVAARDGEDALVKRWDYSVHTACTKEKFRAFVKHFPDIPRVHERFIFYENRTYDRHERCSFIRGLHQSMYYPQILSWVRALQEQDVDVQSLFRVFRSEDFFGTPSMQKDFRKIISSWVGPIVDDTKSHGRSYSTKSSKHFSKMNRTTLRIVHQIFDPWNQRLQNFLGNSGLSILANDSFPDPW